MAMTEERPEILELESGETTPTTGVFARPTNASGWRAWFFTVDHKKIGIMYGAVAMFWFFWAGIEALLIRLQLFTPNGDVLTADQYNQIFTMHGTTMVFLVIMPLAAAFANYMVPLQIGARDVAFPRLNALGLWLFIFGGIFLNLSWFLGGGPDGGWFAYAPNTGVTYSPGNGMDFYALGLQIVGIASLVGSMNLIVTIVNMRAPGMSMLRMPVFTWMILVVQFLLLFALPVITVALVLLSFDRTFDANFFNVAMGADPLLWQHLFWIFGHPEVYVLILPSFGIVSETLPVFSRKPLFGYSVIVISGVAIGFMGWGVWAHHMFTVGMPLAGELFFMYSTMLIAIPTGVKVFNWIATMYKGSISFETPMLFAIAFVALFTIGGFSGLMLAIVPADFQYHDTYFVVAHFHYVLVPGSLFGIIAGVYYWLPKWTGNMYDETLGQLHFWLTFVSVNLTFFPMHFVGLAGMPRRYPDYALQFADFNMIISVGSFLFGISQLLLVFIVIKSIRAGKKAKPEVWEGSGELGLEWTLESPAPYHTFTVQPEVK